MNKDDFILAKAGLADQGLAQTSANDTLSAIDDEVFKLFQNSQPPVIQNKVNTLASAKQEKLDRLAGKPQQVPDTYTNDNILGMTDSDSFNTTNLGNTRTAVPGSNVYYDGIEGAHYKNGILDPYIDIQGVTSAERKAGKFGKSDKVMAHQRNEVARILGKDPANVTEQDFMDVANQQLIQKAANLAGETDWKAPLIRNVVPTNLTGKYINDKGQLEYDPLNILVKSVGMGKDQSGKRELAAFATKDGVDVTTPDSANPAMNINASQMDLAKKAEADAVWNNLFGDTDGMAGESVDIAQSSLVQQYGKVNTALRDMSRWGAKKLGLDKETIDKWLPKAEDTGTIGYGDKHSTDLAKAEVADKITGVMPKTRIEQQQHMDSALKNVKKGNYASAGLDVLTIMPYMLGDSAGEIASLMAGYPGLALTVAGRVDADARTYKKNNGGKDVTPEWLLGSTASNLAVLVGEKLVIGKVLKGFEDGIAGTIGKASKDVLYSTLGETMQEYADQTQQMYMTQKDGSHTLGEVATSPEAQLAAISGGLMGHVMSGTGVSTAAAINGAGKTIDVLDEKIKYHGNNLENPDKTSKPITLDGKYNMWDSVGQPNFKVEDPKAKDTYAQTIAEFAADLHFNQDARIKYGYMGQKSKGEKNIDDVLEDATNKIADVYDLKDPKSKEIAKYLLTQKLVNVAKAKDAATGKYKISKEEQEALLKETADFIKGSKPAEIAFLDMQKQELKDAFTNKVNVKKADEYMTKYGLDQVNNGQIIADLMTLDDKEYDNLKKSVQSMKLMGSSDSVIVNEMDSISKDLDILRKAATTLGSDEGSTGTSGTTKQVHKKTYQEVADEVKHAGFLTRNGTKKSLDKHAIDMELLVGHDHIPEEVQNGPITALEEFVKHRGINKVRPFSVTNKETNNKILNTDTGISTILKQRINENNDLLNIVDTTLNRIDKEKNPETVQRLEKMKEDMLEHQKQHEEIQKLITSPKEEDKKLAYHKLNEYSTGLDSKVIDELLATHPNKWHTYDPNYKKVDTTDYSNVDTTEADMSGIIPELQNPKNQSNKKFIDNGIQPKNEYQEVVKGDMSPGIPKTYSKNPKKTTDYEYKKLKNTPEESSDYYKNRTNDNPVTISQQKTQEIEELNKRLQIVPQIAEQYTFKNKLLKQLYPKYVQDLNQHSKKLELLQNKAQMLEKFKESKRYNELSKALQKHLDTEYNKIQKTISRYNTKLSTIKDVKNSTNEELQTLQKQFENLQKDVEDIQNGKNKHLIEKENQIDVNTLKNHVMSTTKQLDKLTKIIDSSTKKIEKLSNTKKELQKEHSANWKEILKLRDKLKKEHKKLKDATVILNTVKNNDNSKIKLIEAVFKRTVKNIKQVVAALKGWITRYQNKHDNLQQRNKEIEKERNLIVKELDKLLMKLPKLKEIKKNLEIEHARTVRSGMEEILGDLVEPNNKNTNSISALLAKNAPDEQIMELMPRIIKKSKDGIKMIQRAKAKFAEFKAMRETADDKEYPIRMFPTETVELDKNHPNPLVDFTNGKNSVPFHMLWDLEERESTDPEYKAYKDEIRRNVKNAMHVASVLTLKDMIDVRMGNSEYIDDMVDQGFASVWNNIKDEEQTKTQKAKLKKAIKYGQIVPEAVFRENAGRRMFKELELMLSKDLEIQQITDIQNAMGILVINNLLPVGKVNGKLVTKGEVPNVIQRGLATLNDKGVVELVNTGDKSNEMKNGTEKLAVIRTMDLSKLDKQYLSDIGDMGTVLEFAEAKNDGSIGLEKMTHKKGATIKNSDVPLANGVREYLNKQGSIPWKFVGLENKLKSYKEEDPENYIENFTKDLIGTEEDLVADTPTMNLESELAKHRSEALIIERMLKTHEMVGDDKKFYVKWNYTVSGRSMMDNKLVNPQSSGLSRFVVAADGMINDIDTKTISQEEINHLELAMAQALDIDIDKQPYEDALAELHSKFVTIEKTNKGLKLNWAKTEPNRLKSLVEDKEFTLDSIRELNDKLEANADIDPKAAELEYSSKTILHMVQAVDLLRDIEQGKDKISTNLAIEADGITNGMAIMLMQMGWSNYTQNMLRKAGVYAIDDEFNNHGDYKKAGNTDIYESPVKLIQSKMGEEITGQIDELLGTTKWRNFMKNPVMTFIYGSGLGAITKSVAESLIIGNSYIPGALATGKINELLKFAEVNGIEPEYKKYVQQKDGQWKLTNIVGREKSQLTEEEKKKYAYLNDYQIAQITRAIVKKIEDPFTKGFTDTFKDVIEFRQALKTVEQANYAIFNIKFNEKVKALGKTKMNKLTIDELKQIKQEMIDEGTYYATDSAIEGGLVDYWKTGQSDTESGRITVAINTNSFQSRTGTYNRDYNQIIKDLEASVGAIGVTTIHAVDGSIMIEGHIQDVLNVYDALVMGSDLKKNTEQVQGMNKAFYDINTRHSILGKAVEKLVAMAGMRNGAKIDSDLAVQLLSDIQRINPEYEIGAEEKLVNDIMDTLEKIDVQREALAKQDMIVNQYAASSDIAGVDTRNETVNTDGRYKVFGADEEAEVKAVKEALEWMLDSAVNVINEEEVKKNAGIMIDKLSNVYNTATENEKAQMMQDIEEVTGVKNKTFAEQLQEIKKDC